MRPHSILHLTLLLSPLALTSLGACSTDGDGEVPEDDGSFGGNCNDADPLTYVDWGGFCDDRVDDNCAFDTDPDETCNVANTNTPHPCNTGDEPCPATLPGSAAPVWDCTGDAPTNVIAFAHYTAGNDQVSDFCAYVYESEAVADEFYIAMIVNNGPDVRGPDQQCNADFAARRHFFLSTGDASCEGITIVHPAPIDEQPLSNPCRKAMRNLFQAQATFNPDIQFFASSREEANAKLDILTTAEVACIGINNTLGQPYRPGEIWTLQAAAPVERLP
jgi:hypothetical protein